MNSMFFSLKKLGLTNINGYYFESSLNNGSALSAIYSDGHEKVVIKFLINPKNTVELERFKLEFSVLKCNYYNSFYTKSGYKSLALSGNTDEDETDSLPKIKINIFHSQDNHINYFGYKYEEGVLLSDYDTSSLSLNEKLFLITRISSALNYFNRCGYVHRDLHPKNVLLLDNPKMYSTPPLPRVII